MYKNIEDHQGQITPPILYENLTIMIGQLGLVWLNNGSREESMYKQTNWQTIIDILLILILSSYWSTKQTLIDQS